MTHKGGNRGNTVPGYVVNDRDQAHRGCHSSSEEREYARRRRRREGEKWLGEGWGHQIRQGGRKRIYDGGEDKNDNDLNVRLLYHDHTKRKPDYKKKRATWPSSKSGERVTVSPLKEN